MGGIKSGINRWVTICCPILGEGPDEPGEVRRNKRTSMGITSIGLPERIQLYRTEDGYKDWIIKVPNGYDGPSLSMTVDSTDPVGHADRVWVKLSDGERVESVGEINTDTDSHFDWYTEENEEGTYTFRGRIEDDSSRIVGRQDATNYDALKPGRGEWIVEVEDGFNRKEVHREDVIIDASWISPSNVTVESCGTEPTDIKSGESVTISGVVNNKGWDPMTGVAEIYAGDASTSVQFNLPPRGEKEVEASFTLEGGGQVETGIDLNNVTHNY